MAQQSPKELLSPLSDCRQHCWLVEIISSKYTWLKDSCLTASSVRQFVQHKNVSEHLSLQTCTGSCGHTLGMPCICYRCIHHLHWHCMEITLHPGDVLLPPPQPGHLVTVPCVHSCPSTALLQLCSDCWQGRKPQLWVQGLCCLPAKQRKQLGMQVPVQMGGKPQLSVLSQELSAADKIMILGQFWWTIGDSVLLQVCSFVPRLEARAEPSRCQCQERQALHMCQPGPRELQDT